MGACASRPKELDYPQAQLPGELPTEAKVQGEAALAPQENKTDAAESQPLVHLSEPTQMDTKTEDDVSKELNKPAADLVPAVDAQQTQSVNQTEETVVAATEQTQPAKQNEEGDHKIEKPVKPENAEETEDKSNVA